MGSDLQYFFIALFAWFRVLVGKGWCCSSLKNYQMPFGTEILTMVNGPETPYHSISNYFYTEQEIITFQISLLFQCWLFRSPMKLSGLKVRPSVGELWRFSHFHLEKIKTKKMISTYFCDRIKEFLRSDSKFSLIHYKQYFWTDINIKTCLVLFDQPR